VKTRKTPSICVQNLAPLVNPNIQTRGHRWRTWASWQLCCGLFATRSCESTNCSDCAV
jgi:hypothetical protein